MLLTTSEEFSSSKSWVDLEISASGDSDVIFWNRFLSGTVLLCRYSIIVCINCMYHLQLWWTSWDHTNPPDEDKKKKTGLKESIWRWWRIITIDRTQMDKMLEPDILCFPLWGISWFSSSANWEHNKPSRKRLRSWAGLLTVLGRQKLAG